MVDFWKQPMNEQAFDFFSVLAGYSLYALVFTSKDSFGRIFLKKYFANIPLLLCLIAIEFMWPLVSSGPLYTRVAKHVLRDCDNNWWKHIALIGNDSIEEGCIGHTFFTSVNLQLTILGLFLIHVLHKNKQLGLIISAFLCVGTFVRLFVALEGVKAVILLTVDMKYPDSVNYLLTVHFPTYPHIPCFLVGLLTCYFLKHEKFIAYSTSWRNTLIHGIIVGICLGITSFSPALHNIFHLIPFEYYRYYIVSSRILFVLSTPIILTMASFAPTFVTEEIKSVVTKEESVSQNSLLDENRNEMMEKVDKKSKERYRLSLLQGLERLALAMHLINYFYIKFEFLSSRILMDMDAYSLIIRAVNSTSIIVLLGLLFHIFFVAPINSLVRYFILDRMNDKKKID
jgi:hypothetical protein